MKNLLLTTFLLVSNLAISQDYQFNLLSNYEASGGGITSDNIVLSNINDQSYFLEIREDFAILDDLKRKVRHRFKLKSRSPSYLDASKFRYKNSRKLERIQFTSNSNFRFETVAEDSLYKTIKVITYKDNVKVNDGHTELKAKKMARNLFPLYRFSIMHLFESRTDIDLKENLLIISSHWMGAQKSDVHLKLFEEVNLKLSVD